MSGFVRYVDNIAPGQVIGGLGDAVPAGGTPNTMGSWVELLSAGENLWGGDLLVLTVESIGLDVTDSSMLMDVSLFDGSTDHVIVDRLAVGYTTRLKSIVLPISIPSSVAIRARCQCATTSRIAHIGAHLMGGGGFEGRPMWSGSKIVALSGFTGSRGVSHLCGIDAYSAWADLVPSVSGDYRGFIVAIQGAGDTSLSNRQRFWWQIGLGAAPALTVAHLVCVTDASETIFAQIGKYFPIPLPNATQVRFRGATMTNLNRTLDVSLYGVR